MIDNKCWIVYIHTNMLNRKKYVGITSKSPERRWGKCGSGYKKNVHFWNAIQKYGWENFKHEIIFKNETHEYACKIEKCLVKHYKTNNPLYGYNLTGGGDKGCTYSEESRRKISESRKGKYTGENSSMYGISPKERMDEETYIKWLQKHRDNCLKGQEHPMYGISPKERMDEKTYEQWLKKLQESPKSMSVRCIETNKEYKSAREAERLTGIGHSSILKSCNSEDHSVIAGGFHWCYANDKTSLEDLGIQYNGKRYIMCVETSKIYKTAREVKRDLGCDDSFISKCCKGKVPTVYGFHWKYVYMLPQEYEELCKTYNKSSENLAIP